MQVSGCVILRCGPGASAESGVVQVHDLHVWEVTSGFPAPFAHIHVNGRSALNDFKILEGSWSLRQKSDAPARQKKEAVKCCGGKTRAGASAFLLALFTSLGKQTMLHGHRDGGGTRVNA
jgi:hypothetical protein